MRRFINIISFILILIICVQCQVNPNLDAQVYRLKKAIKENPQNPDLYFKLGLVYETQGKYGKAKKALKQSILLNPHNAKAYNSLGHIYRSEKDYPLAIENYQKAIQSDDRFMEPYTWLAYVYGEMDTYNQNFTQKRLEILSSALEKCDRTRYKDRCINVLNNLCGVLYYDNRTSSRENNLKSIIEYAKQGLELLKDEEGLTKSVFSVYFRNKKKINSSRGLFHYYLGRAYMELNEPKKATYAYDEALNAFKKAEDKYYIGRIEDIKKEIILEKVK